MPVDYIMFFRELLKRHEEVGSIIPSSRYLARAMVSILREKKSPRKILEVGPGTGPITRQIVRLMEEGDELFICEVNAQFLARLKSNLKKNPHYLLHRDQVHFIQAPVQSLGENKSLFGTFDSIICSLPFTNFTPELVQEIIGVFQLLLAEQGSIAFFEYFGMRKLSSFLATPDHRERLRGVDGVISDWKERAQKTGGVKTKLSLLNIPPALSVHLSF